MGVEEPHHKGLGHRACPPGTWGWREVPAGGASPQGRPVPPLRAPAPRSGPCGPLPVPNPRAKQEEREGPREEAEGKCRRRGREGAVASLSRGSVHSGEAGHWAGSGTGRCVPRTGSPSRPPGPAWGGGPRSSEVTQAKRRRPEEEEPRKSRFLPRSVGGRGPLGNQPGAGEAPAVRATGPERQVPPAPGQPSSPGGRAGRPGGVAPWLSVEL